MLDLFQLLSSPDVNWWEKEVGSSVWPSMVTHTRNLCSAFNPSKCTHTVVNTHLEQWAANVAVPGEQVGVRCLAQGSHLSRGIEGGESAGYSPPPTHNPCRTWDSNPRPSGYKSNSLSIRPRLLMDWSGVDYLWIIVMFLSVVWTLILTAPIQLQSIHCWDTDAVTHFYKPDEETNSS